jgi:hypothetical protein
MTRMRTTRRRARASRIASKCGIPRESSPSCKSFDAIHNPSRLPSRNTAAPMPQIVSALPSASVPATALLNQPTLKILKRPASSSPAPTVLPRALESLADKQARYENARQKIFGSDTTPSTASQTSSNTAQPSTPPIVRVTREPLGPGSPPPSASAAKGFTGRRTHRPDVSSPPS